MEEFIVTIVVEEDWEYAGEYEKEIPMEDAMMDKLVEKAKECQGRGIDFSEEVLDKELPEISKYISDYVNAHMEDDISMDEDQTLEDFYWYIRYPDDMSIGLL